MAAERRTPGRPSYFRKRSAYVARFGVTVLWRIESPTAVPASVNHSDPGSSGRI
jgi:hypothetical protein